MKMLRSFAFYALVAPALALGTGSVLAEPPTDQDMEREQKSNQGDQDTSQLAEDERKSKYANPTDSHVVAGDRNAEQSRIPKRGYLASAPTNGMQASNLIGAEVKTTGSEDVGTVSDLIIDHKGQVMAIIVGVGGFLGMGEKDVAIGWGHVTKSAIADNQKELRIDLTREDLRAAPAFETKEE